MTDLEHIAVLLEEAYQASMLTGLYVGNVKPQIAWACGTATGAIAKAKQLVQDEIDATTAAPS